MEIYGAGSLEDVRICTELGVTGILTNPQGFEQYYQGKMTLPEITAALLKASDDGRNIPVYIQVHGRDAEEIAYRVEELHEQSPRVRGKIIADEKGFRAIKKLREKGILCVATCLFSVSQAAVAAMVGAQAICPFITRATEIGMDMGGIIRSIKNCYADMPDAPKILAASLKSTADVNEAFVSGADAVALRYPLLQGMMQHVLTTKAEALFAKNWENVKGEDVSYMKERIKLSGLAE
ncbi:MAG: hypothetical protein J6D31_03620 [Clostridia bacterium]|nr:hypothetical protein [Clostridia bacterium]